MSITPPSLHCRPNPLSVHPPPSTTVPRRLGFSAMVVVSISRASTVSQFNHFSSSSSIESTTALDSSEHKTLQVNGFIFHVALLGLESGPVVLLVHGFPELWFSWRFQFLTLADLGYRTAAPDLRQFGISDAPGVQKVFMVGHAWGAYMAWMFSVIFSLRHAFVDVLPVTSRSVFGWGEAVEDFQKLLICFCCFCLFLSVDGCSVYFWFGCGSETILCDGLVVYRPWLVCFCLDPCCSDLRSLRISLLVRRVWVENLASADLRRSWHSAEFTLSCPLDLWILSLIAEFCFGSTPPRSMTFVSFRSLCVPLLCHLALVGPVSISVWYVYAFFVSVVIL